MDHDPTEIPLEANADAAAELAERAKQTRIGDFKFVVGNKRGRRFVYGLLANAGCYRTSFAIDPCSTAFNEGRRDFGLTVLVMLHEHAPEEYALMLSEHNARSDR